MAPDRAHDRAKDFENLVERQPQDFDPELANDAASGNSDDEDGSSAGSQEDESAGRAHYVKVEKSRLRKASAPLGPRYRGARVTRDDVENSDDDGDHGIDWEEEDEDEGEEDEVEKDDEDEDSMYNGMAMEDDSEADGERLDDDESDEDDESIGSEIEAHGRADRTSSNGAVSSSQKAQLLSVMKEERSVASSLSKAAQIDAEKGQAVKKQKGAFDSLLSTRIKLQKALVGGNTILGLAGEDLVVDATEAMQAAESAALRLWSSLNELRAELSAARGGQKRKRSALPASDDSAEMWKEMLTHEESNIQSRNATLQKWSAKIGQEHVVPQVNGLQLNRQGATLVDTLQQHISDSDRLLKRARTPRSCAPLQLSRRIAIDERIYDDADFYGQLLKELLEQRSSRADAAPATIDVDFKPVKAKRNVDTKASKGRKMRYVVHEKLQNFMAPENRGTWSLRQADELFGSLFGRRIALGDDIEMQDDAREVEEDHAADTALLMFGQS